MASVTHDKKTGRRTIQFVGADGKRRSIRLGKVNKRQAEAVKVKVEDLAASAITNHPAGDETSRWVATLDDELRDKLAAVGLLEPTARVTLKAFIDDYIQGRTDIKVRTRLVMQHTRRNMVDFFGPGKPIRDITPGDADDWRLHLLRQGLADNTARRRCGIAKQFFKAAVRKRLIIENPFLDLPASVLANNARFHFISREDAQKVLDACPDAQWRLLFALSRYGGLRCPSELLGLRWVDVDWARNRVTVRSPKTEHHHGHESRQVPLFPELLPYLQEAFDQAKPGAEFIITRYRDSNSNLRTQLNRIIQKAGLTPWPKLFQNLRSTRETELAESFPMHVVCSWIGNSQPVAAKHYLQVTDEHFTQAVQNPVQQASARARTGSQSYRGDTANAPFCSPMRTDATPCVNKELRGIRRVGLEPTTR